MPIMQQPATIQLSVPFVLPAISDKLLQKLSKKIVPVVEREDKLFYIKPVHPRKVAFTWDLKLAEEATNLEKVVSIKTLHHYGAPVLFKPSIAEVLAQIPAGYIDSVTAFTTVPNRASMSDWPEADHVAMHWGFHLADTTLYKPI